MEDWIKDQIKFGRTICLYDNKWSPIYQINPISYKESLLDFIQDTFDPTLHYLISDNKNIQGRITGYNYYTYFPNQNNPIEINKIFNYFEEIEMLLQTPHWRKLGKESLIFPNEIMDVIWKKFYSDLIVERINKFFYLLVFKFDLYYRNYYVYLFLCWLEKNFDLIFSNLIYEDKSVVLLLEKINEEINSIKNRDYSFESKCPQFLEICRKIKNVF